MTRPGDGWRVALALIDPVLIALASGLTFFLFFC